MNCTRHKVHIYIAPNPPDQKTRFANFAGGGFRGHHYAMTLFLHDEPH